MSRMSPSESAGGSPAFATNLVISGTVSVAAATCLDANIASTAAIIKGEPAVAWLTDLALPARLVTQSGAITTTPGWPPPAGTAT